MSSQKLYTVLLASFLVLFAGFYAYAHWGLLSGLRADFEAGQKTLEALREVDQDQEALLLDIERYRDGLYALNLTLEARNNIRTGQDDENPYLVFPYTQVLQDLRKLLPRDSRLARFQVSSKGLVTLPVESVDYASLARVIKLIKESELFLEVFVPTAVARTVRQKPNGGGQEFVYTVTVQGVLDPLFWQNMLPYSDVTADDYFAQALRDLTVAGMVEGYSDGTFRPHERITQAEFFKMLLYELLSRKVLSVENYERLLAQMQTDWSEAYTSMADSIGLKAETLQGLLPDQPVPRWQSLKMLAAVFEIPVVPEDTEEAFLFLDVPKEDTLRQVIRATEPYGLFEKTGPFLSPALGLTRLEAVYFFWRLKFR